MGLRNGLREECIGALRSLERRLGGRSIDDLNINDSSGVEVLDLEGRMLSRVRYALGKALQAPDRFGRCEECSTVIPAQRLRAVPYAECCVKHQPQYDRGTVNGRVDIDWSKLGNGAADKDHLDPGDLPVE